MQIIFIKRVRCKMIKQETININGRELVRTWSDANKYLIQNETGIEYAEAVDVPNKHTYRESEREIEQEQTEIK